MKKIGLVFAIAVLVMSCKKEGCTDSTAANYNQDAKVDDGTCAYQRDGFIGTYVVSETCTYEDNGSYTVTVMEG
jgi:hypothetical protein